MVLYALGAGASAQPAESWVSVRSEHFVLIGDADPVVIRDVANRLEQFREAFRALSPQIKLDDGKPMNVVVFRDQVSYGRFKPLRTDGRPDDAVAGFFQAGEGVNYITVSVSAIDAKTYGTIIHEYVHYLIDTNFRKGGLPPWLNEGLAEYFETFEILDTPNGPAISLGKPPANHLGLLRTNKLIQPKEFFAMDNRSLHRTGEGPRALFYAQAWATVHYLINRDTRDPGNPENVFALLTSKNAREKTLLEAFGAGQAGYETAIQSLISKAPQIRSMPASDASAVVASGRPLTQAQVNAFLGDLLLQMGRLAEAEARLAKAIALDPALAAARSSLGKLLIRQERFAEAKPHLAKAAAEKGADAYTHFYYAYALSREGAAADGTVSAFDPEAAKLILNSLRLAILLEPEFPESYRLLALVHLVNGSELNEAAVAAKKALEFRPNDPNDTLLLAQILLRQEKYDEAKTIAAKLSVVATDARIRSDAHEIVRAVDEYFRSVRTPDSPREIFLGTLPPLILKRSTLTDEDVAAIERDRIITNLNVVLGRQAEGETRVLGRVEKAICTDMGVIYRVRTPEESFRLAGGDFSELKLSVLIEGESSFEIGCDTALADQPVVLTYVPSKAPGAKEKGRLTAIAFVPDFFRLKTPAEMARTRTVIIEDDRLFRSNAEKQRGPF